MKNAYLLFIFCFFMTAAIAQKKTHWAPEQTMKMKNITAVRPSPDGSKVAYTVREAIMTDDRSEYINQVFLSNSDGSNAFPLTRNDKNNTNPKWSPDGKWIAFTTNRDSKNNLYVIPVSGGESEKLTDVKTGVGDFEWRPDGKAIAYIVNDATTDQDEKSKKGKNDWYFMDEEYKQNRLFVLWLNEKDSAGKKVQKKLITENYNVSDFSWSPDGKTIVFSHGKSPLVGHNVYSDISVVDVAMAKAKLLVNTKANETRPLYSPDGKYIAYQISDEAITWGGASAVKIYSVPDGKNWTLLATPDENGALLGWDKEGKQVLYGEADKTLFTVYKLSVDGKSVSLWNRNATDYLSMASLNETGTHLGFVLQNASRPGEAYISSLIKYAPVKLSNIHEEWMNKPLPKTEVVRWKSFDGKEIEGLLTYPMDYEKGRKYPLLLNVHGGPAGVFTQAFIAGNSGSYPIAALAEMGYAVLRPNPRGSSGYGTAFRLSNQRDWGGADYQDLMLGVDHVINMGLADSSKLGVMGWSYGGFMSSWIVGHTNRFKVASIGAPVVDLVSQDLTDDIPGFLTSYMKAEPWEDYEVYTKWSPLRYVKNVNTPVLLQHGEADIRVPFSQAVMFFNALKRRGVPVRLLALPRQPHGPNEPKMALKVMQSNIEWFEKNIHGKGKGF